MKMVMIITTMKIMTTLSSIVKLFNEVAFSNSGTLAFHASRRT